MTINEALPGAGESHVAAEFYFLNVGVYKCLSLIVGFALDCLQSAFSLKICLVLTSSSAIANNDIIITIRDYALVSRGSRLCRSRA